MNQPIRDLLHPARKENYGKYLLVISKMPLYDRLPILRQPLHSRRVEVDTVREEFTVRLQREELIF